MSNEFVMRMRFAGRTRSVTGVALALAAALGGCSADVSRFSLPSSLSLNDEPGANTTGAIGAPTGPVSDRSNLIGSNGPESSDPGSQPSGTSYYPPRSDRSERPNDVRMSALTETPQSAQSPSYSAPLQSNPSYSAPPAPPVSDAGPSGYSTASGETIQVQPGDTLYGLSKRHRVSLTELMRANGLTSPNLKPGQKLVLPAAKATREAALRPSDPVATDARPTTIRPNAEPVAVTPEAAPSDWTGTYVVRSGDSLYNIARTNKLKFTDLQRYNGITDVRRVKPGTILKVPASASNTDGVASGAASAPAAAASDATASAPAVASRVQQPTTILNSLAQNTAPDGEKRVVALNQTTSATNASPAALASGSVADASKLRWPAQGKVIAGFGQRPDGTHNDGVNLAVPMGTEIHAAESGVVAYAGNELKGYGNLVLLRHDNGWVTAYAHSDELLVKRGDKVKRGQVIAKAGKTGQVDQPQVHFELRQGQRPVDPTPHMEKL